MQIRDALKVIHSSQFTLELEKKSSPKISLLSMKELEKSSSPKISLLSMKKHVICPEEKNGGWTDTCRQ